MELLTTKPETSARIIVSVGHCQPQHAEDFNIILQLLSLVAATKVAMETADCRPGGCLCGHLRRHRQYRITRCGRIGRSDIHMMLQSIIAQDLLLVFGYGVDVVSSFCHRCDQLDGSTLMVLAMACLLMLMFFFTRL